MQERSRRDLFRKLLSRDEPSEESFDLGYHRPPGAIAEAAFRKKCSGGGDCVEACPKGAIFVFAENTGELAGTPLMLTGERPCSLCEGFPCAAACPTGALSVPEPDAVKLGTARILKEHCLAHRGPECGACAGLCAAGAEALRLVASKPVIDEARCNGCGLCLPACPTSPRAIEMA
ncbi:MAG: 4Fe-4S dicluster domain-containing protein [Myxococcales bacterium]|nr:4Fe-4S dicluster domain-containing protein [Myxococcales bacterium]